MIRIVNSGSPQVIETTSEALGAMKYKAQFKADTASESEERIQEDPEFTAAVERRKQRILGDDR